MFMSYVQIMINFTLFFQDSKHVQEFLLYFLLDILMHYDTWYCTCEASCTCICHVCNIYFVVVFFLFMFES